MRAHSRLRFPNDAWIIGRVRQTLAASRGCQLEAFVINHWIWTIGVARPTDQCHVDVARTAVTIDHDFSVVIKERYGPVADNDVVGHIYSDVEIILIVKSVDGETGVCRGVWGKQKWETNIRDHSRWRRWTVSIDRNRVGTCPFCRTKHTIDYRRSVRVFGDHELFAWYRASDCSHLGTRIGEQC